VCCRKQIVTGPTLRGVLRDAMIFIPRMTPYILGRLLSLALVATDTDVSHLTIRLFLGTRFGMVKKAERGRGS
jgi:hypothetical protein